MERSRFILLIGVLFLLNIKESFQYFLPPTDDLENNIKPEDLQKLMPYRNNKTVTQLLSNSVDPEESKNDMDCFGLSPFWTFIKNVFFEKKPAPSSSVNTQFYFFSRNMRTRTMVKVFTDNVINTVDFKSTRKTVLIIHGFMSHSNAPWVNKMVEAFLTWADVNVIAVDWSGGSNTWKYWKAVANTKTVGNEIDKFMRQLMKKTGAKTEEMHFVGHSLGAHIAAFASLKLGKVARITGLDPARPCFKTDDRDLRLDAKDAKYVDIIHTNCRSLTKYGLGIGFPDPIGHADFYPNGGMKQPGCYNIKNNSIRALVMPKRLKRSICSHKRAYMYFTESLINKKCSFRGHKWDLTHEGVNTNLLAACDGKNLCPEMGINANGTKEVPSANGSYFVLTTDKEPFCPTESERRLPEAHLLSDLKKRLDQSTTTTPNSGWLPPLVKSCFGIRCMSGERRRRRRAVASVAKLLKT